MTISQKIQKHEESLPSSAGNKPLKKENAGVGRYVKHFHNHVGSFKGMGRHINYSLGEHQTIAGIAGCRFPIPSIGYRCYR